MQTRRTYAVNTVSVIEEDAVNLRLKRWIEPFER
jgi:hypothetical protein